MVVVGMEGKQTEKVYVMQVSYLEGWGVSKPCGAQTISWALMLNVEL